MGLPVVLEDEEEVLLSVSGETSLQLSDGSALVVSSRQRQQHLDGEVFLEYLSFEEIAEPAS